ncbi:peptidyl-tRNA hydrolase [Ranunculus cassubicifolius]
MLHLVSVPNTCIGIGIPYWKSAHLKRRHHVTTKICCVSASFPEADTAKKEYRPWLIVGLGNPGNKYHGTRHNIGFEMIDQISNDEGIKLNTIQSTALIGIGEIGKVPVVLAKSQAYMTYSGESVGPLSTYYQIHRRRILLIYDEMSLPNGVMSLVPKGGLAHHKGVKSVIEHLNGCRAFPRLCIGIGNPPGTMDMRAFLLQKFSSEERKQMDEALEQGVGAVRHLLLKGFDDGITKFNMVQKYKFHKVV